MYIYISYVLDTLRSKASSHRVKKKQKEEMRRMGRNQEKRNGKKLGHYFYYYCYYYYYYYFTNVHISIISHIYFTLLFLLSVYKRMDNVGRAA